VTEGILGESGNALRILIAAISAGTAMAILIATLYFTNRRSKRDVFIKKIEELYLIALEYRSISYEVITLCEKIISEKSASRPDRNKIESLRQEIFGKNTKLLELRAKLEMMRDLYLPELPYNRDTFNPIASIPCLSNAIFEKRDDDPKYSTASSTDHCHELIENILDHCLTEIKKRFHNSIF